MPIRQIRAMAMFDCIVKYMNTTLPPMKLFLPPAALRMVPSTAETITIILRMYEAVLPLEGMFI
jgi:hypothetical protein